MVILQVYYHGQLYNYALQHFPGEVLEQWEVVGQNGSLLLSCDRPRVIRTRAEGYPWEWKVVSGWLKDRDFQDRIIEVLERHVKRYSQRQVKKWPAENSRRVN